MTHNASNGREEYEESEVLGQVLVQVGSPGNLGRYGTLPLGKFHALKDRILRQDVSQHANLLADDCTYV